MLNIAIEKFISNSVVIKYQQKSVKKTRILYLSIFFHYFIKFTVISSFKYLYLVYIGTNQSIL